MNIRVSYMELDSPLQNMDSLHNLPPIERLRWVRREWSSRKQNHLPLMFYFSSLNQFVHCESYLESRILLDLDFQAETNHIVEQPFILHYNKKSHIPDFVIRRNKQITLLNVKAKKYLEKPDNIIDFELAEAAAHQLGWRYETRSELSPQYLQNIAWLAGFKAVPFQFDEIAPEILEFLQQPTTLLEVLKVFKKDFVIKPIIFHQLWHRQLKTDLEKKFSLKTRLWQSSEIT